ncbi:MAG: hypothetical protein M3P00_06630, partial [Gemmatimonadota bacterium]|nr:hypothetical protein [Gemmatimonadota bacterium]
MRNGLVASLLPAPNAAPVYESDQNGSVLPPQNALERPLGALRRYKWLILGIVILSALVGFAGSRLVKAKYEAHSTI